jgi:single stranded DNA-binding protein
MRGIDAALTGRLARDAETRTTKAGRAMVVLNLAVDEGGDDAPPTWVKVLAFEDRAEACAALTKGALVYAEGRLKAEAYMPRDGGEPRASLTVLARQVVPMGQIGRRRPAAGPPARAEASGSGSYRPAAPQRPPAGRQLAPAGDDDAFWERGDEVPF